MSMDVGVQASAEMGERSLASQLYDRAFLRAVGFVASGISDDFRTGGSTRETLSVEGHRLTHRTFRATLSADVTWTTSTEVDMSSANSGTVGGVRVTKGLLIDGFHGQPEPIMASVPPAESLKSLGMLDRVRVLLRLARAVNKFAEKG